MFFVKEPATQQELDCYFQVRYETLRKPWKQPLGSERDEIEPQCIHAAVFTNSNELIGVCRLQFNSKTQAQLRYMGVIESYRGKGVGLLLLNFLEAKAKEKGIKEIILQSRENAVKFYEKSGYLIVEKSYLMWNEIQHYLMKKDI